MSSFDTLPVILVSAANEAVASALISELIDNDVTDDYIKDKQSSDRVWRLVNKYYTANVRVHMLTDDGTLNVDSDSIDAHIIHITEEEQAEAGGGAGAAAARAARAGAGAARAAVRLLLAERAREAAAPAALAAWARAARAELLARREPPPAGLRRARDALHAHAWRGLRRAAPAPAPGERERRAVDRAEAFAAALEALGPALAARGAPAAGAGADAARLDRAEALVTAFCRALGLDADC